MKIKTIALKALMVDNDINTVELSELTGVSRNTISSILNGKSCSLTTVTKLCRALEVPLTAIAEE